MTRTCLLKAAALLLLLASAARGQVPTATIEIRATLTSGQPAPGATVRLESDGQPGIAWTATVNDDKSVVFRMVPTGSYHLSVTLNGFASAALTLSVAPGDRVSYEVALEPAAQGAPEARSKMRLRDRHEGAHGTVFRATELRALPQSGGVWGLLERSDPLTISDRMDNGGISGDPARVARSGASWTQTSFRLGGIDITDPLHLGRPLLYPDLQAFETIAVGDGVMPADAGTGETVVTLVPRRPTSSWQRSIELLASPSAFQSANDLPGAPSLDRLQSGAEGRLFLSGPLSKRVGLVVSATYASATHTARTSTEELNNRTASAFAHLVFTPDAQNEIRVIGAGDRISYPDQGRARLVDPALKARDAFGHVSTTWDHRPSDGLAWSLAAGYQRGAYQAAETSGPIVGTIERTYDGPADALLMPVGATRQGWDLSFRAEPDMRPFLGDGHLVRMGASVNGASAAMDPASSVTIGELVGGLPARVWTYGATATGSEWSETTFAAFATDRIAISSRIETELGIRVESTRGSRRDADSVISWGSIAPRADVTWHADSGGRFTMSGGFGRYAHRLPLEYLGFGDPSAPSGFVSRWNDHNHDRSFQQSEAGTMIAPVGPCCAAGAPNTIDPNLKQPRTDEYFVAIETRLGPSMVLRLTGIDHREYDLVQPVNTGVSAGDYTVSYVDDPALDIGSPVDDQLLPIYNRKPSSFGRDRYMLTNPHGNKGYDHGLDLTLERAFDGRWGMLIGGTARKSAGNGANRGFLATENDQGVRGEYYLDPNAETNGRGRLFFERGYVLKWATILGLPSRIRLGVSARYQDGQHFSRLVIAPDLNQGAEMIQATPRGKTRFTFAFTLDARLEKAFSLAAHNAWVIAEVYNLLNTANEIEENVLTGPTFRTATAVQPPRAIRLGLRVAF